mgnify:CR=1 FL=1
MQTQLKILMPLITSSLLLACFLLAFCMFFAIFLQRLRVFAGFSQVFCSIHIVLARFPLAFTASTRLICFCNFCNHSHVLHAFRNNDLPTALFRFSSKFSEIVCKFRKTHSFFQIFVLSPPFFEKNCDRKKMRSVENCCLFLFGPPFQILVYTST